MCIAPTSETDSPGTPLSLRQNQRKGATLLNNIGCSLLEHGAYADALQTFHDAVLFMSKACSANGEQPFDGPRSSTKLGEHLQAANQRLRSPRPCQVLRVQSGLGYDAATPPFSFLDLEDYRYFKIDERTFHHPYHTFVSPVRVERHSCSCTGRRFDYFLESAVMIYNHGLSYSCLSKCQGDTQVQRCLGDVATRLFSMANSILQHCQNSGDQAHKEDCDRFDDHEEHIVLVRLAVLHSWYQLFVQREHNNVMADHRTGNQILDCFVGLQETMWGLQLLLPATAAAA